MQDTVEVIINADGKSCTTVNPFGKNAPHWESPKWDCWQQAENERKTYEIDFNRATEYFPEAIVWMSAGTIHKAQIINNKAMIL